ncbi:MAG: Gfo/Idh/MocA family oxidoreductase [Armatimonadota bacterium]|nr:Gfo/Idh/MocA family oxidoreductase [Armatimonadota bacterium]
MSFAHGHANAYCEAIRTFDDAHLVAGWDENEARGRAATERFGLEYVPQLDDLLAREDIDAVIVTCETNRHVEVVEAACAAGKHILCQKPMATTLNDCDRIIAAVDGSGVHFQMAFQMRCDPLNQKIKEWIEAGAVGRIGAVRRRHCINFLFNPDLPASPSAWHIDPVKNVGMFFDDAVHAADFLYWLLGKPSSVMAEIDNVLTTVAPDDTGIALYRWPNGAMGVLFNASVTLAGENTCEIYGDEGVIIQNYDDAVSTPHAAPGVSPLKLFRKSTGQWEEFAYRVPASHYERLKAVPRPWLDHLKSGTEPTVTARDGKVSVEMCLAAYQSAREGRRVILKDIR